MWKRTLWRRVDLMEKQNKPFFAINRELSKIIIEAVQRGVLIPYRSDSVKDTNIMNREDFLTNIQQETFEEEDPFGGSDFFLTPSFDLQPKQQPKNTPGFQSPLYPN